MNNQNPYAAPQTLLDIPAPLPVAEESTVYARNYNSFCWAIGFLLAIWCSLPVVVIAAFKLRSSDGITLLLLLALVFFLASCWLPTIPQAGWIRRWFQISVGLQAISCILLGAWLFDEFQSGWMSAAVFLLLSFGLIALHAGIYFLGRELHSPSLVQPACVAMGSLGLAIMFFLLGMYADYISARDASEALLVFGSLCLLIGYIASLITLGFAWKMPRVISARMQRCFPLRLAEGQNPASQFLQDLQQQETDQGSRSVSGAD